MQGKDSEWVSPRWIALYTKAHAEKQVTARLEEMGIEAYLPVTRKLRKWSDRVKMMDFPVFPSYTFARIVAKQVVSVRGIDGVVMPIAFGGSIAHIPDNDIEVVRIALQKQEEYFVENIEKLHKGVRVRVLAGSFQGYEGVLLDTGEAGNFAVKIEALNIAFIIHIDKECLEALPEENATPTGSKKKYHIS